MGYLLANDRGSSEEVIGLMGVFAVLLPVLAWAAALSWGAAPVVQAPEGFSYTVAEVMFSEPRTFSVGAGVSRRLEVVQVVVRGSGFRPKATGPIIWLNGIASLRTTVAEDGSSIAAYFLEPLGTLEAAAARLGRWELIYQPHEGAREVYRVSPSGFASDADRQPEIVRLTAAARARLEMLRHRFHLQ